MPIRHTSNLAFLARVTLSDNGSPVARNLEKDTASFGGPAGYAPAEMARNQPSCTSYPSDRKIASRATDETKTATIRKHTLGVCSRLSPALWVSSLKVMLSTFGASYPKNSVWPGQNNKSRLASSFVDLHRGLFRIGKGF
jgi:hypothetical protein